MRVMSTSLMGFDGYDLPLRPSLQCGAVTYTRCCAMGPESHSLLVISLRLAVPLEKNGLTESPQLSDFYTPTYQHFNEADYYLGNPAFADDVFKAHPTLKVDRTKVQRHTSTIGNLVQ